MDDRHFGWLHHKIPPLGDSRIGPEFFFFFGEISSFFDKEIGFFFFLGNFLASLV